MAELRIAVGSDERTELTDAVVADLTARGMTTELHGALVPDQDANWPVVAHAVATRVASGEVPQGILFCWTGTGVSMAANKVNGARAALCADAATADGARRWNDANILAMSLRGVSIAVAQEILDAWFAGQPDGSERENIERLKAMDCRGSAAVHPSTGLRANGPQRRSNKSGNLNPYKGGGR